MTNTEAVMQLYTAYFNRVADKDGVDYWVSMMESNGWSLDNVATSFADQTEYTSLYNGLSNTQVVEKVYQNVLNRDGEAAGIEYWSGELESGNISVSQLVQAVVNSATEKDDNGNYVNETDGLLFTNKISVSQYAYDINLNATGENIISLSSIRIDLESVYNLKLSVDDMSVILENQSNESNVEVSSADLTSDVGDSINNYGVLSSGSTVTGTVGYSPYDVDWYKIDLLGGNDYSITVDAEIYSTDIYTKIYDVNGNRIYNNNIVYNESDNEGNITTHIVPEENTTYFVEVYNLNFTDTYNLSLSQGVETVVDVVGETENDYSSISLDTLVNGVTDYNGDDDWYGVNLQANHVYKVVFTDRDNVKQDISIENNDMAYSGDGSIAIPISGSEDITIDRYANDDNIYLHVNNSGLYFINATQQYSGDYTLEISDLGEEIDSNNYSSTTREFTDMIDELPYFENYSEYSIASYNSLRYEDAYLVNLDENSEYKLIITSDDISVKTSLLSTANGRFIYDTNYYALSNGENYTYVYSFKTGDGISFLHGEEDLNIDDYTFAFAFDILDVNSPALYENYNPSSPVYGGIDSVIIRNGFELSSEDYIPMNTYQGIFSVELI